MWVRKWFSAVFLGFDIQGQSVWSGHRLLCSKWKAETQYYYPIYLQSLGPSTSCFFFYFRDFMICKLYYCTEPNPLTACANSRLSSLLNVCMFDPYFLVSPILSTRLDFFESLHAESCKRFVQAFGSTRINWTRQ
ncbi:unnamed protein product [Periconia digitata]|uniref:Uncharacterized protein n=1 Tax=Periconia digitata TaxID=1303443 RepID=A0A9W4UJJ1_9PLEO|nr:unnamed protein product [Periconia digitata]